MGGIGSGPSKGLPRTTDFRKIDLAKLKRRGLLVPAASEVIVTYEVRTPSGQRRKAEFSIPIEETETAFGGARKWFTCLQCGSRCRIVYLRNSGPSCRVCCRAKYHSQSEAPRWRGLSRAQAIRRRLGGTGNMLEDFPPKPRAMHWRTYDAMKCRYDQVAGDHYAGLAAAMGMQVLI